MTEDRRWKRQTMTLRLRLAVRRLRSSVFGLSSAVLGLFALAACASLGRSVFATPTVELRDIRMKSIGMQGGAMDIILDVMNPNDYRLDATRLTYNLFVDTVPVSFSIAELVKATQLMSQTGGVDYHVIGEVTAATPGGSFTRPYKGDGHFDNIASLRPR